MRSRATKHYRSTYCHGASVAHAESGQKHIGRNFAPSSAHSDVAKLSQLISAHLVCVQNYDHLLFWHTLQKFIFRNLTTCHNHIFLCVLAGLTQLTCAISQVIMWIYPPRSRLRITSRMSYVRWRKSLVPSPTVRTVDSDGSGSCDVGLMSMPVTNEGNPPCIDHAHVFDAMINYK